MKPRTAFVEAFALLVILAVVGVVASALFPPLTALFALAVALIGLGAASRLARRPQVRGSLHD